jgi:hypothetical protein
MKNLSLLILSVFIIYSCSNQSNNEIEIKEKSGNSSIENKAEFNKSLIEKLSKIKSRANVPLFGLWGIDSLKENDKIVVCPINDDSNFLYYEFKEFKSTDLVYSISSYNEGIKDQFFGNFVVRNDSLFFYSEVEEIVHGFKFKLLNDNQLILFNQNTKGYKDFNKTVIYLSLKTDDLIRKRMMAIWNKRKGLSN